MPTSPSYGDVTWVSDYDVDPFMVSDQEKVALLADWSAALLAHDIVAHSDATLHHVLENKFYADLNGTTTTQQRVRTQCSIEIVGIDKESGRFDTMRTLAPPVGRGWEWLTGASTTGRPSSTRCRSCSPRSCAPPRSRAATMTWSSTRRTSS